MQEFIARGVNLPKKKSRGELFEQDSLYRIVRSVKKTILTL